MLKATTAVTSEFLAQQKSFVRAHSRNTAWILILVALAHMCFYEKMAWNGGTELLAGQRAMPQCSQGDCASSLDYLVPRNGSKLRLVLISLADGMRQSDGEARKVV